MGRMKELYIKMIEEDWQGTPEEYLVNHNKSRDICPNCSKSSFTLQEDGDIHCNTCGYDFIRLDDGELRFK